MVPGAQTAAMARLGGSRGDQVVHGSLGPGVRPAGAAHEVQTHPDGPSPAPSPRGAPWGPADPAQTQSGPFRTSHPQPFSPLQSGDDSLTQQPENHQPRPTPPPCAQLTTVLLMLRKWEQPPSSPTRPRPTICTRPWAGPASPPTHPARGSGPGPAPIHIEAPTSVPTTQCSHHPVFPPPSRFPHTDSSHQRHMLCFPA